MSILLKFHIIDYDIIDFIELQEYVKDDNLFVNVKANVRIVTFENNKITSKFVDEVYILKRIYDDTLKLNEGVNIIKCHNCGASIDVTKGYCEYCHTKIKYFQSWVLEN